MPGLIAIFVPGAGIGTQTDTDPFNTNQDPIVGNWTTQSVGSHMRVVSLAATTSDTANDADAYWNIWSHGNDQYSQGAATITGTAAGSGIGVTVRRITTIGTLTMYRLVLDAGGNYELLKFVSGGTTSLRTGTVTYVGGQKIGLSATGSAPVTLKIWYNAVQIGANVTDSSSPITTGSPGICYSSTVTSASLDNWDAGTVP